MLPSKARILSQFFTPPSLAAHCWSFLQRHVAALQGAVPCEYLEPSAGKGALYDCMPPGHRTAIEFDPELQRANDPDWHTGNFLAMNAAMLNRIKDNRARCIVFMNPPFGVPKTDRKPGKCSLVTFLNHAAQFADTIGIIVPFFIRRERYQSLIDPALHLIDETMLHPRQTFEFEGRTVELGLGCLFQVWQRNAHCNRAMHPDVNRLRNWKAQRHVWTFVQPNKHNWDLKIRMWGSTRPLKSGEPSAHRIARCQLPDRADRALMKLPVMSLRVPAHPCYFYMTSQWPRLVHLRFKRLEARLRARAQYLNSIAYRAHLSRADVVAIWQE